MALSEADVAECMKIMTKLKRNKESAAFRQPVDAVKLGIPHYHDIITSPMDLHTIEQNLKVYRYHTVHDFAADVRLIWSNCEKFNGKDNGFTESAGILDGIFTQWLEEFLKKKGEVGSAQVTAQYAD
eukprot:TRINITY_DN7095_c0_g1_i2.p1 TRINITY_DN7095_c0_g1~~TRINITY_DN7095_c0_g1_i2.p1  ORF type:complete len:141 (-),score=26.01 TRINITY_DN7095_c0_g1_i2:263-643(-)